jgi:chromosome segregation ATPase
MGSDKKSNKKGTFPTTPRSMEKQKKIIANTLRIEMDTNIRLKAHNRTLKEANREQLDTFANKDQDFQSHLKLNSNARREIDYKQQLFKRIKENLSNLDPRLEFQEKNLRGLVQYAKKLTVELEEQKQKVVMSEQIVQDLKAAGSDNMGSLVDQLNILKERQANSEDEISKLKQLDLIKDDEIINLDIELKSLQDFMRNVESTQQDKINAYRAEIEKNQKIIRRTDKLIVDLQ